MPNILYETLKLLNQNYELQLILLHLKMYIFEYSFTLI